MSNGISNQSLYVMFPTIKTVRLQRMGRKKQGKKVMLQFMIYQDSFEYNITTLSQ